MVRFFAPAVLIITLVCSVSAFAQVGSIRGMVYDRDFEAPLPAAQITIAETDQKVTATDEGNYVFPQVAPGVYTLVFSKDGYTREVRSDVVVSPGSMTEVDVWLAGEFSEMEEFIVQDIDFGGGTEVGLLQVRFEAPAMMDSISKELMSQAGVGDAGDALRLVTGATVQDGKYAVVRGLPDRYVNSQLNSVRLPTADIDKRAVQLDQYPSAIIESVQVSKTFTPDQQGDASGGAVNVVLKGIPDETTFSFSAGVGGNSQVTGNDDFLSYRGGGLDFWGGSDRGIPSDGVNDDAGLSPVTDDAMLDFSWSLAGGGQREIFEGVTVGGFASFFYKSESSFYDDGENNAYWLLDGDDELTPQYDQGSPQQEDCVTSLFDVTKASQEVQWGGLATVGVKNEDNALNFIFMFTRSAEDSITVAEDTRGREYYNPDITQPSLAPYLRTIAIEYTERTASSFQLNGKHTLMDLDFGSEGIFMFGRPELDWTVAYSKAEMDQPDKRQFATAWSQGYTFEIPGLGEIVVPDAYTPFKPSATFSLGNLQRINKNIEEDSKQAFMNFKLPFTQWSESEGYFKFGMFIDKVERAYDQQSYANFGDNSGYNAAWEDYWSEVFPYQDHPMTQSDVDVDYDGEQQISAFYYMLDLPVTSQFNIIGGLRHERTELSTTVYPASENVYWYPPGIQGDTQLEPGDADADIAQDDILPSIGLVWAPHETLKFRASFSQTIARQTFKELTPVAQMEYLGGDVFIGNNELQMSSLDNYDLRFDYVPYEGGLVSISWFYKKIEDPIEYIQRFVGYMATTATNYPEGEMRGYEVEFRQHLGQFWPELDGLNIGANATFIDSEVTLTDDELEKYDTFDIPVSPTRDMSNAPDYLYNLNLTYNIKPLDTKVGIFYIFKGDTLVAGEGQNSGNYVPNIYESKYGTLNVSLSKKLNEYWTLKLSAKNITNPDIDRVYRSEILDGDTLKDTYKKGVDFGLSISAEF